ncbi:MAG: HipA domain-containing protein [Bacteroidales bacterium]|nr:HipA domain-containing protein [Bacteroidales bacterium]
MTKRFDRVGGEKIHMQTLCGIAHYDFHLRRAYSYEQAFNVMRRLRLPYSQAEEMFLRMVFNVVIRNQDDHTKNISFLMDKNGKWRLSPAYDIGFAYNPEGSWTDTHQMSINGKFDEITRKDLLVCAASNNIKNAAEIIDKVCETASGWPEIAMNCGVPKEMIDARLPCNSKPSDADGADCSSD